MIAEEVRNWEYGGYITLSGAQNKSLDELECRPAILASSCADWGSGSTFESPRVQPVSQLCHQSPSGAVAHPDVQPRAVESHLCDWGTTVKWNGGSRGCFHPTAVQSGSQASRPACHPPSRRAQARSPLPVARAAAALARVLKRPRRSRRRGAPAPPTSAGAEGREHRGQQASVPHRREIPAISGPDVAQSTRAQVGGTPLSLYQQLPVLGGPCHTWWPLVRRMTFL